MTDNALHVVAGVIFSPARDRVLIARRPRASHQGGLWEFPGGKLARPDPVLVHLAGMLPQIAVYLQKLVNNVFG